MSDWTDWAKDAPKGVVWHHLRWTQPGPRDACLRLDADGIAGCGECPFGPCDHLTAAPTSANGHEKLERQRNMQPKPPTRNR